MKKRFIGILALILLLSGVFLFTSGKYKELAFSQADREVIDLDGNRSTLIAHAGGGIYGFKYSNSLEALERSYSNGHRYMELDFEWTSDGRPVLIHDWESMMERLFMTDRRVLSHEEFKSLPTLEGLTMMDLGDLIDWMGEREDAYIVTDVKTDNLLMLEHIARDYPEYRDRFIPQIYSFEEYEPARELGFKNIILTLYMYDVNGEVTDDEIVDFVREKDLLAVTMEIKRAYTDLLPRLYDEGVTVFVHTVNELYIYEELYERGARGLYTDFFEADHFPL